MIAGARAADKKSVKTLRPPRFFRLRVPCSGRSFGDSRTAMLVGHWLRKYLIAAGRPRCGCQSAERWLRTEWRCG